MVDLAGEASISNYYAVVFNGKDGVVVGVRTKIIPDSVKITVNAERLPHLVCDGLDNVVAAFADLDDACIYARILVRGKLEKPIGF